MSLELSIEQAKAILNFFGGEDGEMSVGEIDGYLGWGLYIWCTECPEEGAEFLGPFPGEIYEIAVARAALSDLRENKADDKVLEDQRVEVHRLLNKSNIIHDRILRDHHAHKRALWKEIHSYVDSLTGPLSNENIRERHRYGIEYQLGKLLHTTTK